VAKESGAGRSAAARLLYVASFLVFLSIRAYSVTITGSPGSLSLEGISNFNVSQLSSTVEIKFSFEGKTPEIPPGLGSFVFLEGKNQITVKIPLDKEPSFSVTNNTLKIQWLKTELQANSIFDVKEPPAYPLGPSDRLIVEVYGIQDINKEVVVDPAGYVTLPLLDKLKVQGLTLDEFQRLLEGKFNEYINEPQINVQLKEYGSRFVNIIGEVQQPRRIPLRSAFRLLDAISEAGGFTANSGGIEIQRRNSSGILQKMIVSKDSLLSAGEGNENIYVFDQDTLNVLPISSVYVSGQVKSPQSLIYTKDLTLLRAIAKAGGFGEWANKDKVIILRQSSNGETQTLRINAGKIEKGKEDDTPLMPNDNIVVDERKLF
jgi:polysaccharide biosynthesis/export protein